MLMLKEDRWNRVFFHNSTKELIQLVIEIITGKPCVRTEKYFSDMAFS